MNYYMNNVLEVILITYNRIDKCEATIKTLLSEKSPLNKVKLTIIDNKSTDGTTEMICNYCLKYDNISHIINNKNIGGNLNIIKAFESATSKYVWCICDDDIYNFDNWETVESAINENNDLIVVSNMMEPEKDISNLCWEMTFLPSCIIKTELITNIQIVNAGNNIVNMFSHLPLFFSCINNNKRIFYTKLNIVTPGLMEISGEASYVRGMESDEFVCSDIEMVDT